MAVLIGIPLLELSNLESNQAIKPTPELLDLLAHYLKLSDSDTELIHRLGSTYRITDKTAKNLADYISTVPCTRTALRTSKNISWFDAEWVAFVKILKSSNRVVGEATLANLQNKEVIP